MYQNQAIRHRSREMVMPLHQPQIEDNDPIQRLANATEYAIVSLGDTFASSFSFGCDSFMSESMDAVIFLASSEEQDGGRGGDENVEVRYLSQIMADRERLDRAFEEVMAKKESMRREHHLHRDEMTMSCRMAEEEKAIEKSGRKSKKKKSPIKILVSLSSLRSNTPSPKKKRQQQRQQQTQPLAEQQQQQQSGRKAKSEKIKPGNETCLDEVTHVFYSSSQQKEQLSPCSNECSSRPREESIMKIRKSLPRLRLFNR